MSIGIEHIRRPDGTALVAVRPEGLPAGLLLAKQAIEQGRPDQARALLDETTLGQAQQLVWRDPSRVDVMAMVGLMLLRVRQLDQAESWFRRLLDRRRDPWVLQQLAQIGTLTGRFAQATDLHREALDLAPEDVEIQVAYGLDLIREGLLEEGLARLQKTSEADPDNAEAHAKWLFHMHYLPEYDRAWLADQYRQWGQRHMPVSLARTSHDRDPDPHRRLRVGLLSGDLRSHSVAYGLEPILEHYDRDQVQLHAYSNVPYADAVTERLKAHFEAYRDICGLHDEAAADLIERDRIDVLVAVAGHTDHHRLGVLAHKPAPIQMDFQGINTTGMAQVDYRLTDAWLDPPGSESLYVERSVVLPGGLLCYRPPDAADEPGPPPMQRNGFVTFGSFNNAMKVNRYVIGLWAEVLKAVPDSRFLLKFAGGDEPRIRQQFLTRFGGWGIPPDRVQVLGWRSPAEHLRIYNQVDIALDTYPFNGCITTLEGLWMGVPLVALVGDRYTSRIGLDILSRVGLDSLVTHRPEDYVAKAVGLAGNLSALTKIRSSLRRVIAASPLCDGRAHARDLERALRGIWQRWCEDEKSGVRRQGSVGSLSPTQHSVASLQNDPSDTDRIDFSVSEKSDLRFTVSRKGLPGFLCEAASAVKAGDMERARAILIEPAIEEVRRIPREDPAFMGAAFLLALLLAKTEQPSKAEPWYQEVVSGRPHPLVYFELANLARAQGRLSQALAYQRKAVDLAPESLEMSVVLADYLIRAGCTQEGTGILRKVVDAAPDRTTYSKVLWHLHQMEVLDQESLLREHRRWADIHAPMRLARTTHDNDPDPHRRIRVGYISPDFCGHSVAYFFESLLEGHDPCHVETFGYGDVACQDVVTERLQGRFHCYRNICGTDDQAVVRLIERDRIDILVDLAGHTGENRLAVLARRPAPIQVSFLGYPDTTGMTQIDYRFTDVWADLPEAQRFYTEELSRLPSGFVCYRPPGFAPAVGPLPAHQNGFVTFGSFNNNGKINAHVLDLWAQILQSLPNSRLLLKFEGGDDAEVRQRYLRGLAGRGADPGCVAIVGRRPVLEHLDLYNQVDMGLDTYPYHGTTTTCEAMWMGVPTVTLVGTHHASRVGLSLLTRAGLEVFTSATDQEYVAKAVAFAKEPDNLAVIRRSLRSMMQASTLCNAKAYARDVEAAYRRMWQRWCDRRGGRVSLDETAQGPS